MLRRDFAGILGGRVTFDDRATLKNNVKSFTRFAKFKWITKSFSQCLFTFSNDSIKKKGEFIVLRMIKETNKKIVFEENLQHCVMIIIASYSCYLVFSK